MKLTEAQAWEVYLLAWLSDCPQTEIARMYGVQPSTVSAIKHGITWGFQPWVMP